MARTSWSLIIAFLFIALIGVWCPSAEALRAKKRSQNLSIFNPFVVLDAQDIAEMGQAGTRYAQQHPITKRNPILLVPGTHTIVN
jgi:hypothetical protein